MPSLLWLPLLALLPAEPSKSDEKPDRAAPVKSARTGWLASKRLAEVRPLDDAATLYAADPRRTGGRIDEAKVRARQAAIVRRVLAQPEPVVVLVLGGSHDLTEEGGGRATGRWNTCASPQRSSGWWSRSWPAR
jgi:hypothetical protein